MQFLFKLNTSSENMHTSRAFDHFDVKDHPQGGGFELYQVGVGSLTFFRKKFQLTPFFLSSGTCVVTDLRMSSRGLQTLCSVFNGMYKKLDNLNVVYTDNWNVVFW